MFTHYTKSNLVHKNASPHHRSLLRHQSWCGTAQFWLYPKRAKYKLALLVKIMYLYALLMPIVCSLLYNSLFHCGNHGHTSQRGPMAHSIWTDLKGVPSAESSRSVRGLEKGVSGKPYPRLCNARRPRLESGTFRSQAVRLYRLH